MSHLQAIILGAVQGLTEFLPVSSSGHLVILQSYLGFEKPLIFFDVLVHGATLAVVVLYFRQDLFRILGSLTHRNSISPSVKEARKMFYLLLVGTISTGALAIFLEPKIEIFFVGSLLPSVMLIVSGCLLWIVKKIPQRWRGTRKLNLKFALLIGLIQGIAIIPGISRSGSTISLGLLLGLKRETAFRFSFLLSIPAILGALVLETKRIAQTTEAGANIFSLALAVLIAFVVGYFSLKLLHRLLKENKFFLFSYYCWAVGAVILGLNLINL